MIDPILLPIVPPMDLNRSMPGIDRISPFPLELRSRASLGLFGTRRSADNDEDPATPDIVRMHEGVDLLAPVGTPVAAAASGKVIGGSASSLLLLHEHGFRYLTFYQHMRNKRPLANGDSVAAGQYIAEVGDFSGGENHLHFEIRYPYDASSPTRTNSLPVDPTMVLYSWEERSFQNDSAARHVETGRIANVEYVVRNRMLRFCLVQLAGVARDLWIPTQYDTSHNRCLMRSIESAFARRSEVRIVWRESQFFKNIQTTHPRVAIIAEVSQ